MDPRDDSQVGSSNQIFIENMITGRSGDGELLLEAIKSDRPSLMTPVANRFNDDEIQRVVSQVRNMEQEFCDDTNRNNFKFEIERTDSLEFTRNSGTADGDEDVNDADAQNLRESWNSDQT